MTKDREINQRFGIPEDFLDYIDPYIADGGTAPETPDELIALWREGIKYLKKYKHDPKVWEHTAAWMGSASSRSSLVNDNDIFEAVYLEIGFLETQPSLVGKSDDDAVAEIEKHIKIAEKESRERI